MDDARRAMPRTRTAQWTLGVLLTAVASILLGVGSGLAQGIRITDGDTFRLGEERIRVWGIDAPEAGTVEGDAATRHLTALLGSLGGADLSCSRLYLDRYGRTVARCLLPDGTDMACAMVRGGHARDWPRYSDGYYASCAP